MKMQFVLALLVLAALYDEVTSQVDCTDLPDGVHGWGCRGYTLCEGGEGTHVDCIFPEVFNEDIMACDDYLNVAPPCGVWSDCSGLDDGLYADLTLNCTAYYTCQDEIFLGHNPCSPGTVFNEELQVCDFPENVAPPCGTYEGDNATTTAVPYEEKEDVANGGLWEAMKDL